MLILDEPTSGVDPVARDAFWQLLIDLSRRDGVTVFLSTHFMNEAERCDRISLMHAGKVLCQGPPADLVRERGARTLEETFIGYLEDAEASRQEATGPAHGAAPERAAKLAPEHASPSLHAPPPRFSSRRLWAYAPREAMEIRRDPVRLSFALLGPVLLMIVFGYGITFDVDHLPYAVLDQDRSPDSRAYLASFSGSPYFEQREPIINHDDMERRLRSGELKVAIEIPPAFGRDVQRGRAPAVGVWIDGAMPNKGETSRGYVESVHQLYASTLVSEAARTRSPVNVAQRFRYNPEFRSVFAMVPGIMMLLLVLIPAMMTAVGVVREKEVGSITNVYATPVTSVEFLLGKQMPYSAIALANFVCLMLLAAFLFQVPMKGSAVVLVVGTFLYVVATTGFGLLISSFASTQVAAIFAAGILTSVPAISFSGWISPTSSLSGSGRVLGRLFPSMYFQAISLGTYTKQLGFAELRGDLLALAAFAVVFLAVSAALLPTQER
jgi:ribosome-dependent ATPase